MNSIIEYRKNLEFLISIAKSSSNTYMTTNSGDKSFILRVYLFHYFLVTYHEHTSNFKSLCCSVGD